MPKSKLGFIVSISVGVILMIAAVIVIINDAAQNLYNSNVIIGRVVDKDIIRIKRYKYPKNHFFFKLVNSNQNFTIFRTHEGYSDLESAIKIGDTLKVYFSQTKSAYNKNVYQVEKNNVVLESIDAYKKEKGTSSLIILFSVIVITSYSILAYYNLNLGVLLMRIVEPNYKKNSF
jgi:hypothetical protein